VVFPHFLEKRRRNQRYPAGDSTEFSLGQLSSRDRRVRSAALHHEQRGGGDGDHGHQYFCRVSGGVCARTVQITLGAVLFDAIAGISMFPQIAIAGPVWRLLSFVGWLNSYHGIVAAYIAFSLPFAVWVLTTFFRELPYDIEEAALIDGCTRWQALRLIVFPLAAPGIFTAAILVFIQAWNEFFFALIILTYPALQTLPVGIALFPGEYTMPWGEIAAASTLATLPLVALTLLFQRRIVQGLSAGAVKG